MTTGEMGTIPGFCRRRRMVVNYFPATVPHACSVMNNTESLSAETGN
jgi:hypothetical protein